MTKAGARTAGRKRGADAWELDDNGVRTALTTKLSAKLVRCVRDGHWPQMVALECNVTPDTLLGWLERGADPLAVNPYRSFAAKFLLAESNNCAELQDVLMAAALGRAAAPKKGKLKPDVDVARWLLERRYGFLWRGGGVAAMAQIAMTQERRGMREKATAYLQQLPLHEAERARGLGFVLPVGGKTHTDLLGESSDEQNS